MKNNKGFSLVELIVVIAIMAILAAVAIPTFATFITKANVASDEQFVADLTYAIELANTASGEKVSAPTIVAEGGVIKTVTYKVGDTTATEKTVVITVTNHVAAVTTPASATTDADKELIAAAKDAISTIDWTYDFKSAAWADGDADAE